MGLRVARGLFQGVLVFKRPLQGTRVSSENAHKETRFFGTLLDQAVPPSTRFNGVATIMVFEIPLA
jgi:hypothetical protein